MRWGHKNLGAYGPISWVWGMDDLYKHAPLAHSLVVGSLKHTPPTRSKLDCCWSNNSSNQEYVQIHWKGWASYILPFKVQPENVIKFIHMYYVFSYPAETDTLGGVKNGSIWRSLIPLNNSRHKYRWFKHFDIVGWMAGRASSLYKKLSVGILVVVIRLELAANDMHVSEFWWSPPPPQSSTYVNKQEGQLTTTNRS